MTAQMSNMVHSEQLFQWLLVMTNRARTVVRWMWHAAAKHAVAELVVLSCLAIAAVHPTCASNIKKTGSQRLLSFRILILLTYPQHCVGKSDCNISGI